MEFKRISYKHKNNKPKYYIVNYLRQLIPNVLFQKQLRKKLHAAKQIEAISKRVAYYNKLSGNIDLKKPLPLSKLKSVPGSKVYFFDIFQYSRFFSQKLRGHFLFGDVVTVAEQPTFVKSRPINDKNQNSILLKWNKLRHFMFIKNDTTAFKDKKNMLVSRGKVHQSQTHRIKFLEMYFKHPMCNIGKVNNNNLNSLWKVPRLTINQQLTYKFILCLEGNDVASNLKWVMSSNSIAVMTKPKFETWFMEGLLKPDFHYVQIKDDYSDLEERLNYYITHTQKAMDIIHNANQYVSQFKDHKQEELISLCILEKYFIQTNQKV